MILVMEPIRDQMRTKPRYWKRLYSVLFQVLQGDTPVLILQVSSVTDCMIYPLSRPYQILLQLTLVLPFYFPICRGAVLQFLESGTV